MLWWGLSNLVQTLGCWRGADAKMILPARTAGHGGQSSSYGPYGLAGAPFGR